MEPLELHDVTKRFADAGPPAVDRLSLRVEHGEILALLGPSGCGKTTILRLIAGLEAPDSGTVVIRGRAVAGREVAVPPEDRGVGIVFQDYALFPHLNVMDNVAFGIPRQGREARRARVSEVLALVGMRGFEGRYPHELSGGQQQRVAVARAMAPAPALMLLDEPFSSLDADLRAQMRDDIESILRSTATTTVFVTHDQEEAFTLADRVGVLHAGRVEQLDTPQQIYHRPATRFVASFVGAADFLPGTVTNDGIVTEIGTFANADEWPAGERVDVMIRPDDISFVPESTGGGVIASRHFRGSETVYGIRLASGYQVHSSQPSSSTVAAGTRVRPMATLLHVVAFPSRSDRVDPISVPHAERSAVPAPPPAAVQPPRA